MRCRCLKADWGPFLPHSMVFQKISRCLHAQAYSSQVVHGNQVCMSWDASSDVGLWTLIPHPLARQSLTAAVPAADSFTGMPCQTGGCPCTSTSGSARWQVQPCVASCHWAIPMPHSCSAPEGLTNASERQLQRGLRCLQQMAPSRCIFLSALPCAYEAGLHSMVSTPRVMTKPLKCLPP